MLHVQPFAAFKRINNELFQHKGINDNGLFQGNASIRDKLIDLVRCKELLKSPLSFPFRFCHTVLKFARSPYLDNHLSESIHTCTIDTL